MPQSDLGWEGQADKMDGYGLQELLQGQMETFNFRSFGDDAQWICECSEPAAVLKEFPGMCHICSGACTQPGQGGHRELSTSQAQQKNCSVIDLSQTFLSKWIPFKAGTPTSQHPAVSQVHLGMNMLGVWIIEWMCETVIKKLNWSEPWSRLLCFVFLTHQDFIYLFIFNFLTSQVNFFLLVN